MSDLLVRPPAVSGSFYPGSAESLAAEVDALLEEARGGTAPDIGDLRALVVPHAGYGYSGPTAATAYALLSGLDRTITRVVVLGPAHWAGVHDLAVTSLDAFYTPLGLIMIDAEARERALQHEGVALDDAAHRQEHSIEVQLPFLTRALGEGWKLLPMAVGHATPALVADVLEPYWDDPSTLVVVSTDLSHYLDQEAATRVDRETAAAVVALDVEAMTPHHACGAYGLAGLLEAARRHGFSVRELDLRTSGDTGGDRTRVVGYGAFAVTA